LIRPETNGLNIQQSVFRDEIVITEPTQLSVEQIEVIFTHTERFAELFAKENIFFAETLF
jgi:hypothetical protein